MDNQVDQQVDELIRQIQENPSARHEADGTLLGLLLRSEWFPLACLTDRLLAGLAADARPILEALFTRSRHPSWEQQVVIARLMFDEGDWVTDFADDLLSRLSMDPLDDEFIDTTIVPGLLGLMFRATPDRPVPTDFAPYFRGPSLWGSEALRVFYISLNPKQTVELLLAILPHIAWDWSTHFMEDSVRIPEAVPHLVALACRESPPRPKPSGWVQSWRDILHDYFVFFPTSWEHLPFLIEATEQLLAQVELDPFNVDDTRPMLWTLAELVLAIYRAVEKKLDPDPSSPLLPRLQRLETQFDARWPHISQHQHRNDLPRGPVLAYQGQEHPRRLIRQTRSALGDRGALPLGVSH